MQKFSNIDYKKYINFEENLRTFESFISSIIQAKIKKIKKNKFQSLFNNIDSYIKEKYDLNEENKKTNFIMNIYNYFRGNKKKEKNKIKYYINNIDSFITMFKSALIKINFIKENFIFNEEIKLKVREYAEKYLYLKDDLKNNDYYQKSFYEDFKNKLVHIMSYSKEIINRHLNGYLNDIITEAKGVIHTIDKKFNMNKTEFEKKFSEDVKQNIIIQITNNFDLIYTKGKNEIEKMKEKILKVKNSLNCDLSNPIEFQREFNGVKYEIDILISITSDDIQTLYLKYQNVIQKIINDYIEEENVSEKNKINFRKTFQIRNYFSNINFEIMHIFAHVIINLFGRIFRYYHDYKEDIKKACENYSKMLYSSFESIENDLKNNFEDLKTKGIKLIKIIFNTATSNFEELQKNYEIYTEIKRLIQNILKKNNL